MTTDLTIKGQKKNKVFDEVKEYLDSFIRTRYVDDSRPWGGFFTIDETDTDIFIKKYYPSLNKESLSISGKLSPKILLVEPGKKLSWQYHHRRAEIWKVIAGKAMIVTSDTDEEKKQKVLETGDIVELKQGERHRLIGLSEWAAIAEIWRHTDPENPSDEDDIVRVKDDFGR